MFGPGKLGLGELLLIFTIALVIFGPSKLPELGRSMGEAINQFKNASKEITDEINKPLDDKDKKDA
ncbi:twin-arginine translocase TatA/TatE family subunit [Wansuia hejianensis]|uniref:Sec-independent protein translocase protein TatA n=1 Tax=Wansuia hejianensis TaxID=2763667 RepID=A0A926F2Z5_9FIRM|nr:twin-arginine translocase TatA/TatE family subunit [Wansuia hejianensis]MBC8590995.1 twin-arginine translocase TatA/TatE family subunit [Wansuia hejianensis]